jgi:hypothetical protein
LFVGPLSFFLLVFVEQRKRRLALAGFKATLRESVSAAIPGNHLTISISVKYLLIIGL